MKTRNKLNTRKPSSPISILRDKSFFDIIATNYCISTPKVLGIVDEDRFWWDCKTKGTISFVEYMKKNEFDAFLKVTDGECADGVFHIKCNKEYIVYHNHRYSFENFMNIIEI